MDDLHISIKALADETRFKLFSILLNSDCCVGTLARYLGVTEANISQHLQILRKAGLVVGEKRGYWTHYSVVRDRLSQMSDALSEMAEDTEERFRCPKNARGPLNEKETAFCGGCCVLDKSDTDRLEA